MSDGLKRTLAAIIGTGGVAYIAWLMFQHQTFVPDSMIPNQMLIGGGFIALFLILVIGLAIKPFAIKRLKWWVVAYSVMIILLGHYLLINKADAGIYAGDIVKVIGVLIFFLSLSGALITKKTKRQIERAMQEVIEV